MGDTSQNPWVVVSVSPEDRRLRVDVGSGVVRSSCRQFRYFTREAMPAESPGYVDGWGHPKRSHSSQFSGVSPGEILSCTVTVLANIPNSRLVSARRL